MEISAHPPHAAPATEAPAQGGRWLEEDIFDRVMPSLIVTVYLCAAALAILMGIY